MREVKKNKYDTSYLSNAEVLYLGEIINKAIINEYNTKNLTKNIAYDRLINSLKEIINSKSFEFKKQLNEHINNVTQILDLVGKNVSLVTEKYDVTSLLLKQTKKENCYLDYYINYKEYFNELDFYRIFNNFLFLLNDDNYEFNEAEEKLYYYPNYYKNPIILEYIIYLIKMLFINLFGEYFKEKNKKYTYPLIKMSNYKNQSIQNMYKLFLTDYQKTILEDLFKNSRIYNNELEDFLNLINYFMIENNINNWNLIVDGIKIELNFGETFIIEYK